MMKTKQIIALLLVIVLGAVLTRYVFNQPPPSLAAMGGSTHGHGHDHEHGHPHADDEADEEMERGPHGGRLLKDGDFALEITIFERGVPPQFRVYAYHDDHAVDPSEVTLTIQLSRLGGQKDTFQFKKQGEFLQGDSVVEEPHSFDVTVQVTYEGHEHSWTYESYEGRTTLSEVAMHESGITLETAGPREISDTVPAYGRIAVHEDRLTLIQASFAGTVQDITKGLGDTVSRGERLVRIRAADTLRPYELVSPLEGEVVKKTVQPGEFATAGQTLYTIANLDEVWVDLRLYPQDAPLVKVGQSVQIDVHGLPDAIAGRIDYLSPFGEEFSQAILARVVLPNPDRSLRPGAFVSARIETRRETVPLAVQEAALQTFREWDVVFIRVGEIFEFRPVETGRRDQSWVEIISGLEPGQRYAAENSFVVKADILKSGASHDH